MQSPYFYLIYTSISSKLMPEGDLLDLLNQSRRNNTALGLTGMLLYMEGKFISSLNGRFIQLLEGAEKDVRLVYERIEADERNHHVLLLHTGFSESRSFPGWTMGFEALDSEKYKVLPAFFQLTDEFPSQDDFQNSAAPLNYLRSFYQINKAG